MKNIKEGQNAMVKDFKKNKNCIQLKNNNSDDCDDKYMKFKFIQMMI